MYIETLELFVASGACKTVNSSNVVTNNSTWTKSPVFEVKAWRETGPNYPDWKERIAEGRDATTLMNAGRRTLKVTNTGHCRNQLGGGAIACHEVWGPRHLIDLPDIPYGTVSTFNSSLLNKARDRAYTNLIKSYRNALSQWQSGVFLGELPELIRFLKSPAKSLARLTQESWVSLARDLRRLGRGQIDSRSSAALRAATDSWLAYQFAAKPLVNDIEAADKALRAWAEKKNGNVRIRGDGKESSRSHTTKAAPGFQSDNGFTYGGCSSYVKVDKRTDVTVRFLGSYKLQKPGTLPAALDQLGLAPDGWGPTIWELIPWSFVLDYFANIGEVIDAFSFMLVDLEWLMETDRQTIDCKVTDQSFKNREDGITPPNPTLNFSSGGGIRDKHFLVHRESIDNDHVPSFRLKVPNLGQALNLAALANSSLPFRR